MYCSVISAIGMSVIDTSLIRIRCSSRSRGPLKAGMATGGSALSVGSGFGFGFGSSAITAPATA